MLYRIPPCADIHSLLPLSSRGHPYPMQNAPSWVQMLLAKPAASYCCPTTREAAAVPPMGCIPGDERQCRPFGTGEARAGSRIPPHRTDARRVFPSAEFLGGTAPGSKDEDGLYTDDPRITRPQPGSVCIHPSVAI